MKIYDRPSERGDSHNENNIVLISQFIISADSKKT